MKPQLTAKTPFLNISSVDELSSYFGHTRRSLDYIIYVLIDEKKYKEFNIKKRRGGARSISSPNGAIRKLQAKLKSTLEEIYRPKVSVHGYVSGRGIKSNASRHIRKKWVGKVDLQDFFPSIHFGRVFGLFKSAPFNFDHDVAKRLAAICCHKGGLPQGGLTSPIISNIICSKLDVEITDLCKAMRVSYSRYADDMVFSSNQEDFPNDILVFNAPGASVGPKLLQILSNNGFAINPEKTSLISSKSRQMVTGVVVNRKMNVPKEYVRQLKGILHAWKKFGKDEVEKRFFEKYDKRNRVGFEAGSISFEDVIRGKVLHVGAIKGWHDTVYLDLAKKFQNLSERFEVDKIRSYKDKQLHIKLYTEGISDLQHIEAAHVNHFSGNGFKSLKFDFETSIPLGGTMLYSKFNQQKGVTQDKLTIFLFDRDIDQTIFKEISKDGKEYSKWGNGLYAAILPVPSTLHCHEREVSIECYYEQKDLKRRTDEGRRIYTKDEFNDQGDFSNSIFLKYQYPKKKSYIVDDGVIGPIHFNGSLNQVNVALGKNAFSLNVKNNVTGFDNINFTGFKPLFDMLVEIQNDFLFKK